MAFFMDLAVFFEHSPEMLCVLGVDGRFQHTSRIWREKVGFAAEELEAKPLVDFVVVGDRARTLAALDAVRGGATAVFEHAFQCKDESLKRLSWSASPRLEEGLIFAVVREVPTSAFDPLKALADATSDFIVLGTLAGQVVYLNPGGLSMLGRSGQDFRELDATDILAPRELTRVWEEVGPALISTGVWRGELDLLHASGARISASHVAVLLRDPAGGPPLFASIVRDISERRRVEAELRRFKAMADAVPDMIGIANLQGEVIYLNPAGAEMMGKDILGMRLGDVIPPAEKAELMREILPEVLQGRPWVGEAEFVRIDGARIPTSRVFALIRDESGAPEAFATVVRDLRPIRALKQTIQAMSVPILQVWDGVLALPVIGQVDEVRAAQMMEALLGAISQRRCRVAILDLTGVQEIDAATIHHLFRMVKASSLLGSLCVVSGVSANVAQVVTGLGLDVSGLCSFRSLAEALQFAMRRARPQG
jgi:PAS domain S-box-containing protein